MASANMAAGLGQGLPVSGGMSQSLLNEAAGARTPVSSLVAGTEYFADRVRNPENEIVPGVFLFRCDGPLLYFNVQYVQDRFAELLARRGGPIELVIFFLGTTPTMDLAGAEMLEELQNLLANRGIALEVAEAHGGVRETLARVAFRDRSGKVEAHKTVASILRRWTDRGTGSHDAASE